MLDLAACRAKAYSAAQAMVHDTQLAEDIAQRVTIFAWQHNVPDAVASSLARRMVITHWRDYRRAAWLNTSENTDTSVTSEDLYLDKELGKRIGAACEYLDASHLEVFRLKDVMEYSHEEVAEELGITVQASRNRLHRARGILRGQLI